MTGMGNKDGAAKGLSGRTVKLLSGLALYCLLPMILLSAAETTARAQRVVDKMVATVDDGVTVDLITYSDLLWQIALQPDTPIQNPGPDELNRALNLIISQRLILQEANKLPAINPSDEDIATALVSLVNQFPSRNEFYNRMNQVGLSSEQLREIVRRRVAIEAYLDFRFRSFVVITPQEEADYYRDVYLPRFRRQHPGSIVPTLEEARADINRTLTESKIESDTDNFIENARERAVIVMLNPV